VRLRSGIADPAGTTIERALPALVSKGVSGVHVGKTIRFTIEAADEEQAVTHVRGPLCLVPHQPGHRRRVVTVSPGGDDL
jgi:phosphoribosylformylglycinamidine synthase PurS subunit